MTDHHEASSLSKDANTRDSDKGSCAGSRVAETQKSRGEGNGTGVGTLAEKRGGVGSNPSPRTNTPSCSSNGTIYPATHTPTHLAHEMCRYGHGIQPHHSVLEPSAGVGGLVATILTYTRNITAVELNKDLFAKLDAWWELETPIYNADFLRMSPEDIGYFDKVVMCPPKNSDEHIDHALKFLAPGGQLVALVQEPNVDLRRYGFYNRSDTHFQFDGGDIHCGFIYLWAKH